MTDKIDGRTREARAAKRRRRTDNLAEARFNLSFSGEMDPAYEYRWFNDDGARMYQKTVQDDWDVVRQSDGIMKEDGDAHGSEVAHVVGAKKDGSPLRSVLCRKLKEYADEDRRKKEARLAQMDEEIRTGALSQSAKGQAFYQSHGRNTVG